MSRESQFKDAEGRWWVVTLPDGAPDADAPMGFLVGPPSLEPLGLPLELEIRLHNELYARHLLTAGDVKRRRMDVIGALQSALKVDSQRIVDLYNPPKVEEPVVVPKQKKGKEVAHGRRS